MTSSPIHYVWAAIMILQSDLKLLGFFYPDIVGLPTW